MNSKLIVTIIFGIIFIIATVFSIVNASKLIGEGFKEVLGYDNCAYYRPVPLEKTNETIDVSQEEYCLNDKKRNIAESLAYLIVSLPLAIFFYKKFRKE